MEQNHKRLPNASDELFLTDGGLETTLVFLEGFDLPYFAAFDLLKDEKGNHAIRNYYARYLEIARKFSVNFILESPTWRANRDWVEKIGYPTSAVREINEKAVKLLADLRSKFDSGQKSILISGCIGPRGDGYIPGKEMSIAEAQRYHSEQIEALRDAGVDLVSALTMNYLGEAIGMVRAANALEVPVVISFTVETDGKLPTGMRLLEAIAKTDKGTAVSPLYYMINCAHPTHFLSELTQSENAPLTARIKGIRANASCKSHAELDESTELDRGIPSELGAHYKKLKDAFAQLNVFGGCCGTDEEHIIEILEQLK